MGRLDIRSKSPSAITLCTRSQISGGVTQLIVSSGMVAALASALHLLPLLLWAAAIWAVSFYRIAAARWLLRRPGDKAAITRWQNRNLINFLATGLIWCALPWLPRDETSLLVVSLIYLVPTGITAAASHNLGAMPLGLLGLVGPIAINHALIAADLFDGTAAIVMALFSVVYMVVMSVGVLMVNNTLLSEWRLVRINRGIAHRSRAQATALARARLELLAANERLARLAAHDPLTGLANRRQLLERLRQEYALFRRHGAPGALLMIDLDHFKQVNDTHGHQTGDTVLVEAAGLLAGQLRPSDTAARIGGEEFAVLLPGSGIDDALRVAQRLRTALAGLDVRSTDGVPVHVTASMGITNWQPSDRNERDLMERADRALYVAKNSGRDNVRVAEPGRAAVG